MPNDVKRWNADRGGFDAEPAVSSAPAGSVKDPTSPKCLHPNASLRETMSSVYLNCPDCHREVPLGFKGLQKTDIDPLLKRFAEYILQFDRADDPSKTNAAAQGILVHGVLKDCDTGLPIVLASIQVALVVKTGFPPPPAAE